MTCFRRWGQPHGAALPAGAPATHRSVWATALRRSSLVLLAFHLACAAEPIEPTPNDLVAGAKKTSADSAGTVAEAESGADRAALPKRGVPDVGGSLPVVEPTSPRGDVSPRADDTVGIGSVKSQEEGSSLSAADRHASVRRAPSGTPAASVRAFERLPIAVEDREPVGGVASSGLHVDRVALGRASSSGRCISGQRKFSVKSRTRPTICFRIVHDRISEEISVVWRQAGGMLRRTRVNVPPVHGHRTRAHLVLRPEYVGKWTARVVADDSVELAAVDFEVIK